MQAFLYAFEVMVLLIRNGKRSQMTDDTWRDPSKEPSKSEVAIDYIKSTDFRVVWADGAIGAITPNGHIHFSLYAERPAIPRRQVFSLNPESLGRALLGPEVLEKQISRGSIVREMSCDVFLSMTNAENLANWLLTKVDELKKLGEEKS